MWKLVSLAVVVGLLLGGAAQGAGKAAPSNTSSPTISGTAREGETLTASSGSWSGSTPMSFSYRWQRCSKIGNGCSNLSDTAKQTYQVRSGDVGHTLRVSVTASNSDGSAKAVSAPTGVVTRMQAPANTSPPTISGTVRDGEMLTAGNGSWANTPTSFAYQWRRCNASGSDCTDVGDDRQTYRLVTADVGSTMRVEVRAKNSGGTTKATSAQTAAVAPRGPLPGNTSTPVISGTARAGETLVASTGSWTNAPTKYGFQWLRCDSGGNGCSGAGSGQSYHLGSSDVGHRIRVAVAATNQYGTSTATSAPTAVVTAALPGGAIKLPSGQISFPVEQVSLPERLIISAVKFVPARLQTRAAFIGRFRISDTRGYVIRGALVYAIGLPYGWVRPAPEVVTGTDGWATIQFIPTRAMPLHRAALVFFVRARKPGENPLAGVSTRRLVQVGIS